jgi:ribosome-binding protein aMBF1 (putative translation factor)
MVTRGSSDAAGILRSRYVGDDVRRAAEVERERTNAEVAQLIYDRRVAAGLTQKELAKLVGTTQSVISRLEDAEYEGHSLTMLQRIAGALGQRITVAMAPAQRRTA